MIEDLLRADLSPEQVSGVLARHGLLHISHETIYQHVWRDKRNGGDLWRRLRQRPNYRKRYGTREKRGRLAGKRHISERPAAVELRRQAGHWEMDTVSGSGSKHCIVTPVERATGCVLIGKLADHTKAQLNSCVIRTSGSNRTCSGPSPSTTEPSFTDTKKSSVPPASGSTLPRRITHGSVGRTKTPMA